jgi:hypothetical protein
MRLENVLIIILGFFMITILANGIIYDFGKNYNTQTSYFLDNQSKINQIQTEIAEDLNKISLNAEKVGETTGWLQVVSGASAVWNGVTTTVSLILKSPYYVTAIITDSYNSLNIPSVDDQRFDIRTKVLPIILIIINIIILFMIINFIRGVGNQV